MTQARKKQAIGAGTYKIDPGSIAAQTALGNAAAASRQNDEARRAWQAAIQNAKKLELDAQESYIPDLEAKLKKLPADKTS